MITELHQKIIDAFVERETPLYDFVYFYGNQEKIREILGVAEAQYRNRYPECDVIRMDAAAFREDTNHRIRTGKRLWTECDLLIFENIGQTAGVGTDEERLYDLLDWLLLTHRQAIISGAVPVNRMELLARRIRAQLEGGISVPVE